MSNADLSERMKDLAERISGLPSTGLIEAERALQILELSADVLTKTVIASNGHIALAGRLASSCDKLYKQNCQLKQMNRELAYIAADATVGIKGIQGNA